MVITVKLANELTHLISESFRQILVTVLKEGTKGLEKRDLRRTVSDEDSTVTKHGLRSKENLGLWLVKNEQQSKEHELADERRCVQEQTSPQKKKEEQDVAVQVQAEKGSVCKVSKET